MIEQHLHYSKHVHKANEKDKKYKDLSALHDKQLANYTLLVDALNVEIEERKRLNDKILLHQSQNTVFTNRCNELM